MPDYRMNVNGQLGLSAYSNIFDYMVRNFGYLNYIHIFDI